MEAHEVQVELDSLHDVTMDSTKLLTEKLALARELSSLKPEVDHLRSQTVSYQAALADKLSLQRQVSLLQVELETEKRATQRAVAKESKYQAEDARTAAQMESLQADLANERKERFKIEREAQKLTADFEMRTVNLNSRLDSLRTQLKATKDHLRENQSELQNALAASRVRTSRSTSNIALDEIARDPRKRIASRMDDDTIIGTPGDMPAGKKTKKGSTMLGDKSAFSITPFLNRTASIALDNPDEQSETDKADDHADIPGDVIAIAKDHKDSSTRPLGTSKTSKVRTVPQKVPKAKTSENTKPEKANAKVPPAGKMKKTSALEQVAEEEHDEIAAPKTSLMKPNAAEDADTVKNTTENAEMKKRKRKLLGGGLTKTLFDDEDVEAVKGDNTGTRTYGNLGRIALGGSKANQHFGSAGIANTGYGSFSPLKRDKRPKLDGVHSCLG
ncbi:hypothetical protein G7Y79_00064g094360 [Physcia stellaris]|nr:hypothetical protein G7Y79_00064g094360 [Physcia stellaris]